jgi:cyclic pyranopterin phosphate synthase
MKSMTYLAELPPALTDIDSSPAAAEAVHDRLGRPLKSLRVSVIDKCNLRCTYCMPEAEYNWLPKADVLTFDEISRLVDVFAGLGVDKVRLTGGEPLLRTGLPDLIGRIAAKPAITDIAMTTNGVLLALAVEKLKAAGLNRITVSLDTLQPERFRRISQRDSHSDVLDGIYAAAASGMANFKLDTVLERGVNDDEIVALIEFAKSVGAEIRFIEYMDVGGATRWDPNRVFSRREIVERVVAHYGAAVPVGEDAAPADRYELPDGSTFGVISSTTQPFCAKCDRSRLTADGLWYRCLYARTGIDLRTPVRAGDSDEQLAAQLRSLW